MTWCRETKEGWRDEGGADEKRLWTACGERMQRLSDDDLGVAG